MDISFSIDESKFIQSLPTHKCYDFASLVPGKEETYTFTTEADYYQHYSQSYYALTSKKKGWDCLRHYEIIASGCMPFFLDLENCPENTLVTFPKEIVLQAMRLPGVNPAALHIDWEIFPVEQYYDLLHQLYNYAKEHLTCRAVAKRFLLNCGITVQPQTKVLFLSDTIAPDYQRCLLLTGLKRLLGKRCVASIEVGHLYDDYPSDITSYLYGKGFSYSRVLPAEDKTIDEEGPYDLIIYGSCHRTQLQELEGPTVYVCGEDCHRCEFLEDPGMADKLFVRELGTAT